MQGHVLTRRFRLRTAPSITMAAALTVATVLGATSAGAFSTQHSVSLSNGPTSKVIVFLRDTAAGLGAHSLARTNVIKSESAPILNQLAQAKASSVRSMKALPIILAKVTAAERAQLLTMPNVIAVLPDSHIKNPTNAYVSEPALPAKPASATAHSVLPTSCGTALNPELDPEAISVIKADQSAAAGFTGAGVTVAYIADGVNPANADFSRNSAYASSGSTTGSPVVTQVNFTGDPSGTPTSGGEAFLDAGSIGAQGNSVYDLNNYVNTAHPTSSSPCDIKIVGSAPGASVLGLDVFSSNNDTTESNFIQAIDYAVANGVKVLNESFGANQFPDTALDATRLADDAAVAAGVTVVVSSGDAGITNTIGSPASDPNLISVGASTTMRAYLQDTYGGSNDPKANGTWINNNISSLSSGGVSQGGGTINLVAPGDLNWALCDSNTSLYADCSDNNGNASPIGLSGGTSESSQLTAGAAADVIQAYQLSHAGAYPTPALVKSILTSTATDTGAPADQQGAGLLNVLAAVKMASSIAGTSTTPTGGVLVSPSQIDISQNPGATSTQTVSLTNTGALPTTVGLTTRALTVTKSTSNGSFCLNPSSTSVGSCGPPTANTFQIWSGYTEVYQEQTFNVPHMSGTSRLNFSAIYPYVGQTSLLHVALIDPTGAYAGYSEPQGLADFANVQVANPKFGTWTAVFFTVKNVGTSVGSSGTIKWSALSSTYATAGSISPASLVIPAGATRTATFKAKSPNLSGDAAQSIVLSTLGGTTNTIPVVVRTMIKINSHGGDFTGAITGGNGRGNPGVMNTFNFTVPHGLNDLTVSAAFQNPNDAVVMFLINPDGQSEASSSSVTLDNTGSPIATNAVSVYAQKPVAGTWSVVLDWLNPTSGQQLIDPFVGAVRFNQVSISSNLPNSHSLTLLKGQTYTYNVTISNTGVAPESYFIDPRTTTYTTYQLPDQNGSDHNMTLPLAPGLSFPYYVVPTHTNVIAATLTGTAPVDFDMGLFTGDPDVSARIPASHVVQSESGNTASATLTEPKVSPGYWYMNPSEVGPYGSSGAPAVTASGTFSISTLGFNSTVGSPTGDFWSVINGLSTGFTPVYLNPGQVIVIPITITPSAAHGTVVSGSINVDDAFMYNLVVGAEFTGGDELSSMPFSYKVN